MGRRLYGWREGASVIGRFLYEGKVSRLQKGALMKGREGVCKEERKVSV